MVKKLKSFTLIELIVAVVIFMIVFLVTASFVSLASGQVISLRTKMLSNDIRNTYETSNQKANNANAKATVEGILDTVNGLAEYNQNTLVVASEDERGSGNCKTSFFTIKDDAIWMKEFSDCSSVTIPLPDEYDQRLTSNDITINSFSVSQSDIGSIPYVTIEIDAQDAQPQYENDNQIKMRSSFTVDYLMRNNM